MLRAWRLYRALGPEQRRILRDKRFAGSRPVADLLALLKPLAAFDAAANRGTYRVGVVAVVSGIAVFFSMVGLGQGDFSPELFLIPAALGAVSGTFISIWISLRGLDLSDNLRMIAIPLLVVLREEVRDGVPVTLTLDLRRPDTEENLVDESVDRAPVDCHMIINRIYKHGWMSGQAEMVDRARLTFNALEEVLERRRTRRRPGGALKTKTKTRTKTTYTVGLDLPDSYQVTTTSDAPSATGVKVKMKAEPNSAGPTLKLSRTIKELVPARDPFVLIGLVAQVYRRVTPSAPAAGGAR